MGLNFPPYPSHLVPEERRAVLLQAAREEVDTLLRDEGIDPAKVDRARLEAEAILHISQAWQSDRLDALEAKLAAIEETDR